MHENVHNTLEKKNGQVRKARILIHCSAACINILLMGVHAVA
jgi:hypothetical protein